MSKDGLVPKVFSDVHKTYSTPYKSNVLATVFTPCRQTVSVAWIIVCGAMIYGLGWTNWLRLGAWLAVGLVLYFGYGKNHSKLATA